MTFLGRVATVYAILLTISLIGPAKAQNKANPTEFGQEIQDIQLYSENGGTHPHPASGFTDLHTNEWAYQALKNLVNSYGCVAGYPDELFKGNRAISRYEAALLLNACLDNISQHTDEIRALIRTFEGELAILKGRVDGMESRVGEIEATNFTPTTTLRVDMAWLLGGTKYTGNGAEPVRSGKRNLFLPNANNGIINGPGFPTDKLDFVYASRFDLDTSVTGNDLLKVRMEVGTLTNSAFGINTATPLTGYAWFFPKGQGDNQIVIQRLNYTFPMAEKLTITAGAIVRQDEMLGSWPVRYPTNAPLFGLNLFAGAPAAYNLNQGAGGAYWLAASTSTRDRNKIATNDGITGPLQPNLGYN